MSFVRLVDVPAAVARGVVDGAGLDAALAAAGLERRRDWPHADTADALRPLADHPDATGPGTFLVVLGEHPGTVAGDCGWFGPPDADGVVEVGYGLAASARRQGVGTAAVRLLLGWVAGQPGVTRVTAQVRAGNEPSLRLLARLGFAVAEQRHGHVVLTVTPLPR